MSNQEETRPKPKGLIPTQRYGDIDRIKKLAATYSKVDTAERNIIEEYLETMVSPDHLYGYYTACIHIHAIAAKSDNEIKDLVGKFACASACKLSNSID